MCFLQSKPGKRQFMVTLSYVNDDATLILNATLFRQAETRQG